MMVLCMKLCLQMWSDELASIAQAYLETCPQNITSNPPRLTTPPTNTSAPIGENLLIVNTSELTNSNYTHLLQTHWVATLSNCTGDSCKEFLQVRECCRWIEIPPNVSCRI